MRNFPEIFENFWLERARQATGAIAKNNDEILEKLRPAVRKLSDLFTIERPDGAFPDYAAEPALLAAYGLFFFPQSFVRARFAFDQVLRFRKWHPPQDKEIRILDLGSGTGPAGFAIAAALRDFFDAKNVALTAVDHAPDALKTVREIAEKIKKMAPVLPENFSAQTHALDLSRCSETLAKMPPNDIIVASFSANELFGTNDTALQKWLKKIAQFLAPNGVLLVLEPALNDTATTLQRAADALVNDTAVQKLFRWAPELSDAPCPLLAEKKFWNHEVRRWNPPASLAFLNRTLFREISVLKFCYTALGNQMPPTLENRENLVRLVSPMESLKGRCVFTGVNFSGKKMLFEISSHGLSKSEIKRRVGEVERGDIFAISKMTPLANGGIFRLENFDAMTAVYQISEGA